MKKIFFVLFALAPLFAWAGGDDTPYLGGAVPERDGIIVFQKAFKVPGKSKQDIYPTLRRYMLGLVGNSIEAAANVPYARLNQDSKDTLAARLCEWMVFKKKPLYLDRARFRYQMNAFIEDGRVRMEITQISYYYEEDNEGNGGKTIRAEEWISDHEALNKAQTKLYPRSGKFRRKTVDRVKALFEGAMDAFEVKESVPATPVKKVRHGVVEE